MTRGLLPPVDAAPDDLADIIGRMTERASARRSPERRSPLAPLRHPNAGPELSIVVPTFNEAANIRILAGKLDAALGDIAWEMIVVDDDSPDGTAALAKSLGQSDRRIRCIRRIGRRGLAGACIEGMLSSSAPFVAVIDGDLQHDETLLSAMLRRMQDERWDIVIGTRHKRGGSAEIMPAARQRLSRLGRWLSRWVLHGQTSDPMSGFFMVRRDLVEDIAARLSTDGFKILADILASARTPLRIDEIAYVFRPRHAGTSKLGARVLLDYAGFLLHHLTRGFVPIRFVLFAMVGMSGLALHLTTLRAILSIDPSIGFPHAEGIATAAAMLGNFILNNSVTYRDHRHRGWAMIPAFGMFAALCSVGVVCNIGIARWIYADRPLWWLAGLAGALTGAVWNYGASTNIVWGWRRIPKDPKAQAWAPPA